MTGTDRVTIEPEEFKLVEFDRAELTALLERLLDAIGIDRPVTLEIDQTTPLGHAEVRSIGERIRPVRRVRRHRGFLSSVMTRSRMSPSTCAASSPTSPGCTSSGCTFSMQCRPDFFPA